MGGRVRVLVFVSNPEAAAAEVEHAYHTVSRDLLGVPGLVGNQLMQSVHDPGRFVVMSEWEDLAAFSSWEQGPRHRDVTAPLRPLQDPDRKPSFAIYRVTAEYRGDGRP
jgi:heme oxygenase (mycobilin-producing)